MADFRELMQKYVNLSFEELVEKSKDDLSTLIPIFDDITGDDSGAGLIFPLMCTCLAVDGQFTDLEHDYLCAVLGQDISFDDAKAAVAQYCGEEAQTIADKLVDSCPDNLKAVLLDLCTCIMAVDETLCRDELAFIQRLIAE